MSSSEWKAQNQRIQAKTMRCLHPKSSISLTVHVRFSEFFHTNNRDFKSPNNFDRLLSSAHHFNFGPFIDVIVPKFKIQFLYFR